MIHRTPGVLPFLFPNLLWRMPKDKRELYLTFDDGPIPDITEFVLEELHKNKIPASFFCIGDNIRKHPTVFNRIVKEGHTIGNHTFNHLKGWQTRPVHYLENIVKCDEEITKQIDSLNNLKLPLQYFRPPYGRISPKQIQLVKDKQIVMWDVLTRDYDASLPSERCLKGSINAVRNGSIIVFHDSIKAERNLRYTLPRFIEACLQQDFVFKRLPT